MKKRLFVGNLGTAVKDRTLKDKFTEFGDVENVELHTKNDESGKPFKKFAYLDMNISQEKLVDCIKSFNNINWMGSNIIVQVAKESYIQRIQREARAQGARGTDAAPPADAQAEPSFTKRTDRSEEKSWKRSTAPSWKKEPGYLPHNREDKGQAPGEFADEKAFLFGEEEEEQKKRPRLLPEPQCRADVALLRHAWGQRLGSYTGFGGEDGGELEVVPVDGGGEEEEGGEEDKAEYKRRVANAKRLASLKQRAAEGQAQKRFLRADLSTVDQGDRKRRIVFADSEEEEEEQEAEVPSRGKQQRTLTLFEDEGEEEEEEEDGAQDFRVRPQFEGRLGHKALELQSRFATDDRFRLSERFLESDGEEEAAHVTHDDDGGDGEALDTTQERSRNLDILWDVLGPEGSKGRPKPIFKDASQLRFDPTKESAAKFELKPTGKPKKKKPAGKGEEPAPPAPLPQVSSEQFYEVTSDLHDALASRAGGFSLAQMFAGQLADDGRQSEEPFGGDSSSDEEERPSQVKEEATRPKRKMLGLSGASHRHDDSLGDEQEHGNLQPAQADDVEDGPVRDMFRRMDDHRFATVVDRPLFFFVPGDRRLLEGAKFFRCQSDPGTIRRNFFDGRVALVKLLLSKRKMAKRALERRHGKKVGSQQWRLGKLRHKK